MAPQDLILECLKEKFILADKDGTVYSNRTKKQLGCRNTGGYMVCTLWFRGIRKQIKLHQIIWIAHRGRIPVGKIIDHTNRNKSDNSLKNLRLVSPAENAKNRRTYSGAMNPAAKITTGVARVIRIRRDAGLSYRELAANFGVSKSLIASVCRGESWV